MVEHDSKAGQRGEARHRVGRGAVEPQVLRGRRLQADQDDAASGDLSLMPFHPADLGTDTMDEELDESNATRATRELTQIDAALERLYKSPEKFGVCDDGREIPFERLDIIPWAQTCD